jgi:hypothetical protein
LSDQEQDWIAKYRAALDSEQGRRSSAGALIAAIRRALQALGLRSSTDTPVPAREIGSSCRDHSTAKKLSQRDVSMHVDRDTKAS